MSGRKALIVSAALFAIFGANVVLGSMGEQQFLGDLGELGMVILSVIFFVTAILQAEYQKKNNNKENSAAEG